MNEGLRGRDGSFLSVDPPSPPPDHGVWAISATEIRRLERDEPAVAVTTVGCVEPPSKASGGRLEARLSSLLSSAVGPAGPCESRRKRNEPKTISKTKITAAPTLISRPMFGPAGLTGSGSAEGADSNDPSSCW
jgi:hypothetical protein